MNAYLNIDHVSITFATDKGPLNVLNGVNLAVQQGEFITLIGHSGCGKSTVLNIVAGLLEATEGGVVLEGREVTDPGRGVPESLAASLAIRLRQRASGGQPGFQEDEVPARARRVDAP